MKGGCLCRAVRYEVTEDLQGAYYCHCRDCQIASGSPFHVLAITRRGGIELQRGELDAYTSRTDSGFEMTRRFCPNCATPLFLSSTRFAEIEMFTVTTLDDPEAVRPSFEIWTESKLTCASIGAEIERFPRGALDGKG